MTIRLYTQKGYAALIGLLVATLIIALIVYGGSFFSKKSTETQNVQTEAPLDQVPKSQVGTYIDVKKKAGAELNKINAATIEKSGEMNE